MRKRLATLGRNLAVYGVGDVATSIISFLLLPLYVRYLTPEDYGVISLLLTVEVVAKIVFRWGVDASFMRLYYDCETDEDRQRLTSTLFWFLLATNGVALLVALAAAPWIAAHLFGDAGRTGLLRLVLVNTFVIGFFFLPFHLLRMREQSRRFITVNVTRSFSTLTLRLALVIGAGQGVLGIVLADIVVSVATAVVFGRWVAPLIRPLFSRALLREALSFGLPRLPHGVAHQIIAVADRYWLTRFVGLADIGLYSVGASFGLALKLFLSAFETAWAPFYFATMKAPDAKRTFGLVTLYCSAILALLCAGLAAVAPDLVRLMTTPAYYGAASVVPWIALGVVWQGFYLLTSIGLNITKQTQYYPVATGVAAAASVAANLLLIPRFGVMGAAWANTFAYAVLAIVSMTFSQRVYPLTYDWRRLGVVAAAGLGAWAAAAFLVPPFTSAIAGLFVRGATVVAVFPAILLAARFFSPAEMRVLRELAARRPAARVPAQEAETVAAAGEIVSVVTAEEEPVPNGDASAPPGGARAAHAATRSR